MYTLIIVESPAKAKIIQSILGSEYKCIASNGHVREMNIDSLRIDSLRIDSLQNKDDNIDTLLTYKIIPSKREIVSRIKKHVEGSLNKNSVILATDDDREGETIAWHLCQVLHLDIETTRRIIIHEMTKKAIENAVIPVNVKKINMNIVRAQQTRQFIDVMVGYKISPILWKMIKDDNDKKTLSAGRCQTPALRLVYETIGPQNRPVEEKDKLIYKAIGYFTSKNIAFSLDNITFESKDESKLFLTNSISKHYTIHSKEVKNVTMTLKKPFTTSYLLQVACSELKMTPKEVMESCQILYENGYITYMRTDGITYADSFIKDCEIYIKKKYGEKYVSSNNDKSNNDINNDNDNLPHEPIRPTNINLEEIKDSNDHHCITKKEVNLYKIIHKHSLQTLMLPPIYKKMTVFISANGKDVSANGKDVTNYNNAYLYSYSTEQVLFNGYDVIDTVNNTIKKEANSNFTFLQTIKIGSTVPYKKIYCKQILDDEKGPRKFTESSLIGKLEVLGIGRPSTYSTIIDVIQKRGYVKKENKKGKIVDCIDYFIENAIENTMENANTAKRSIEINECVTKREFGNETGKLFIQPIGVKIIRFLNKHFTSIFDYEYTKRMEIDLDLISRGEITWKNVCERCIIDITKYIEELEKHIFTEGEEEDDDDENYIEQDENREKDENNNDDNGKMIGMYKDIPIYVKYGKYGRYIHYNNKMISLNRNIYSIQEKQAISIIENNYERIIDKEVSIRNGKYSDYIYHKKVGKKPIFYKLDGFIKKYGTNSYKTCPIEVFSEWFYNMISEQTKQPINQQTNKKI